MKRTVSILLSLVLLFAFASCAKGNKGNYYKLYSDAEAKTNTLSAYSVTLTQDTKLISADKTENSMTAITKRAANLTDANNPVTFTSTEMLQGGKQLALTTTYFADGVSYYSDAQNKYYKESSNEDIINSFKNPASFRFTEEVFADAEKSDSDKGCVISAKPENSSLDSFCATFAQAYNGASSGFSDVSLTVTVNGAGYLERILLTFSSETQEYTAENRIEIAFDSIGEAPEIIAPEALDTYTEYNENAQDTAVDTAQDTDPASETVSQEDGEAVDAAFALFDENYNKKPDYDKKYKEACDKYGKDTIDSIIEVILALTSLK